MRPYARLYLPPADRSAVSLFAYAKSAQRNPRRAFRARGQKNIGPSLDAALTPNLNAAHKTRKAGCHATYPRLPVKKRQQTK